MRSEPGFPHCPDVERVKLGIFAVGGACGMLVIDFAAGDIEAQHRSELRSHGKRNILRKGQFPAFIVAAGYIIDPLIARLEPGRMNIIPKIHWAYDGSIVLTIILSLFTVIVIMER